MHRLLAATMIAILGLVTGYSVSWAHDDHDSHEVIEKVMKTAMKGGLCKKVVTGKASKEEKDKLVAMFEKLAKAKPGKGDAKSWKAKTSKLVKAAKAVAGGDDKAAKALRKAANCKACHSVHKGK